MNASVVYAFGVGMVATFNPCGFAMLPAYLSYFLGLEGAQDPELADPRRNVLRALAVGATVTAGFLVVFGLLGIVLEPTLNTIQQRLPWVTIALGVGLVVLGVYMLTGRSFTVRLPKLDRGTDSRELTSVFLFGISYALVSLSCTISLFTAAVSTTLHNESLLVGVGAFVAYGLGMGLVLMVLTLAIALARQSLVRNLRRVLPHVNRVSGGLLVVAGAYVAYYGWYELRLQSGDRSGGALVTFVSNISADVSRWVDGIGQTRLGVVLALLIVLALLVAVARRGAGQDERPTKEPADPRR